MPKLFKKIFSKQSYIGGAAIIAAGGFISKLLGALYRIPLTSILGGEGMGIYQMVYPLYCILLTVSASGIPAGIARLIASGRAPGAEKTAFRLYGFIGAIGTALMFALSRALSAAQGEPAVELCSKLLSPAVLCVSFISVVRGYFQGKGNMVPTALTEICEQLLKVLAGVALAIYFRGNLAYAVASTLAAVTVSEFVTALMALSMYSGGRGRRPLFKERQAAAGQILKFTVPITFTAIALPLSQLAESIIAVNLLRAAHADATALYGVFSGCAVTIINLPVSVTYGLAAASVPKIAPLAASGDLSAARRASVNAALITAAVSLPCAIGLFAFAPLACRIIFRSLPPEQLALLVKLVRIMAVNAVTASLAQTCSACLTALGRPSVATVVQWTSCILRVAVAAVLIKFTSLSVTGAAIAANVAYFVAAALNLWYIIANKKTVKKGKKARSRMQRQSKAVKNGRARASGQGDFL